MDGGITVSTGQIVALVVGGLSLIGTLLGIIRHQYEQRLTDKQANCDKSVADLKENYGRIIADKDAYINRANMRMDEQEKTRERQAALIEEAIAAAKKQADVAEAMYEKLSQAGGRRRTAGDD